MRQILLLLVFLSISITAQTQLIINTEDGEVTYYVSAIDSITFIENSFEIPDSPGGPYEGIWKIIYSVDREDTTFTGSMKQRILKFSPEDSMMYGADLNFDSGPTFDTTEYGIEGQGIIKFNNVLDTFSDTYYFKANNTHMVMTSSLDEEYRIYFSRFNKWPSLLNKTRLMKSSYPF